MPGFAPGGRVEDLASLREGIIVIEFRGSWAAGLLAVLIGGGCGQEPAGAPTAASGSGAKSGVKFVGFDVSPPLVSALQDGQIQGLVLQNPVAMGEQSVRTLVAHLEGQPVEAKTSTGELLVTPQNMSDPEVAARLEPPRTPPSEDTNLSGTKQKKYRILVMPKGNTHLHWQAVHFGARKAAEALGNVELVWLSPPTERDKADQVALIEKAITAKVDGIVVAPLDAQALVRPVDDAIAAGIPVVVMDSGLAAGAQKPVSYVATDNYHGGQLAGERLAELLGGEGKIILLRYDVNSEATEAREKGFTDAIAKYPKITYLSDNQYAGATPDSAQQVAQRLVQQYKGQVDGIFCPNESSTVGMLRALKDAGLLSQGGATTAAPPAPAAEKPTGSQ